MIFKVEAQGDTMYIEAENRDGAMVKLEENCGPVPVSLLTWTDNVQLPEGETLL